MSLPRFINYIAGGDARVPSKTTRCSPLCSRRGMSALPRPPRIRILEPKLRNRLAAHVLGAYTTRRLGLQRLLCRFDKHCGCKITQFQPIRRIKMGATQKGVLPQNRHFYQHSKPQLQHHEVLSIFMRVDKFPN